MNIGQYFMIMFSLTALGFFLDRDSTDEIEERKKQSRSFLKENIMKSKLDELIEEKVKIGRRRKIELMCSQAGFNIEYAEYLILSIVSSLLIGGVLWKVLNNPFVGIVFFGIGAIIPKQIIGFIRNKRLNVLDDQVGTFLNIFTKRIQATSSFHSALQITSEELKGEEPISSEIDKTLVNLDLTGDDLGSLNNLAERTGNRFLERFASYYGATLKTGSAKSRNDLLSQAYVQYEEDRQLNRKNKKEVSETTRIIYVFVVAVPLVAIIQSTTDEAYIPFMTQTLMGQIGTLIIILILILSLWVAVNKIGGPLD